MTSRDERSEWREDVIGMRVWDKLQRAEGRGRKIKELDPALGECCKQIHFSAA